MTEYWWRSWHGAPMDHKWPVVAARANVKVGIVSAVAWALLDYASQHSDRGSVEGFDTEAYAIYSGFPQKEIEAVIQAMADKGVIKDNRLTNWEKRQPKREDDSRERVRNWRAGKRSVTPGNGGKPPDKDTEADAETDKEKEHAAGVDIFSLYQNNIGMLTPMIADELKDAEKTYSAEWIREAIAESVKNNARSWKYASAILERWGREGFRANTKKNGSQPKTKAAAEVWQ